MPRTRKTNRGPAMAVQQIAGQEYGRGAEQVALEQAMPTPNQRAAAPGPAAPMAPGPAAAAPAAPAAPMAPAADPYEAAIAEAQRLRGQLGLLNTPTARPDVPITNGLPVGPGAGPEVLRQPQNTGLGQFLRDIQTRTQNPYYGMLADRIGA